MLEEMKLELRPNNHVRNIQLYEESDLTENMMHLGNEKKKVNLAKTK